MGTARNRRLTVAPTSRYRSGRQGSDQPATLAPQTTARLKALTHARTLVRSSHTTDDPPRKVSNAPTRRAHPSIAARFHGGRPTPPVPARVSHNAAPAPRYQQMGAPLPRASAVHVRRANPSVPVHRANPGAPARRENSSAAVRKLPLMDNRALDASAARILRGRNLVTAGMTGP